MRTLIALLFLSVPTFALTDAELASIGQRVWKNECGGTRDGLTSWNAGEDFASLGIGHFIWYPKGPHGPFEESFPKLVKFLTNGVKIRNGCTPQTALELARGISGAISQRAINELRALLFDTIRLQSRSRTTHGGSLPRCSPKPHRTARQCARSISTNAIHQRRNIALIDCQFQRRRNESGRVTKAKAGACYGCSPERGTAPAHQRIRRERRRDPRAPQKLAPRPQRATLARRLEKSCARLRRVRAMPNCVVVSPAATAQHRRAATVRQPPLFVKEARVDDLTGPSAVRRHCRCSIAQSDSFWCLIGIV
jgi:hypothetical protein